MGDKNYTTEAKVNTFLGITVSSGVLDNIILSVQDFIERYTGRIFKADSGASARSYDGDGTQDLIIDDCVEITKVEKGDNFYADSYTTILSTGTNRYYTMPVNNSALELPIRKLHLRSMYFVKGFQNHRITAKWGYSAAVPSDIGQVATFLVASIYKCGRSKSIGGVKSERIGDYAVSFGSDGEQSEYKKMIGILDNYVKHLI